MGKTTDSHPSPLNIGLTDEGARKGLRLSELVSALSYALDLSGGRPPGHAARACLIGMQIAGGLDLPSSDRGALFYVLLLKDAGCSAVAAQLSHLFEADDLVVSQALALSDWSRHPERWRLARDLADVGGPLPARLARLATLALHGGERMRELMGARCHRGSEVAGMLGLPAAAADALLNLDEHWDGDGLPAGLAGDRIPLLARIAAAAQVAESFASRLGPAGAEAALTERRGSWFDPAVVDALRSIASGPGFWDAILGPAPCAELERYEPQEPALQVDERRLDSVAEAFARVIDAKSPFTYRHSEGVAILAYQIGQRLDLPKRLLPDLRRAALLHDLGKLGVSNLILDKPGPLTAEEWTVVRRHPALTLEILGRVPRFQELANVAGSHHELLDGSGYHRGLTAERLPLAARILTVADIAEALAAGRPYRHGLAWDEVLRALRAQAGHRLCADCVEALAMLPTVHTNGVDLWCPLP
jgi:HD-GYP domain-containing protein (c-di-GMP phosphodiesterase class II)